MHISLRRGHWYRYLVIHSELISYSFEPLLTDKAHPGMSDRLQLVISSQRLSFMIFYGTPRRSLSTSQHLVCKLLFDVFLYTSNPIYLSSNILRR